MKKLVFLVVIAASVNSQAAKFATCMKEVAQECGQHAASLADYSTSGDDCKIVDGGKREAYPYQPYAKKVVFKDKNTLFSMVVESGTGIRVCSARRVDIPGKFKTDKAFDGRLFAVTSSGNVIVITRNNTIQYLTNSHGDLYQNVTNLKIDQEKDKVEIYFNGNKDVNGATVLTLQQVLEKLNKGSLAECVTGGCT